MRRTLARGPYWVLGFAVALALAASLLAARWIPDARARDGAGATPRLVSLSPAVTETLFAIGAGDAVVGVSDYCAAPPAATERPRAGTSITPNFERIAALHPSAVVTSSTPLARLDGLRALAPTHQLPWLTVPDVVQSVRRLGAHSGRPTEAEALAARLEARLGRTAPPEGPRVLLMLGGPQPLSEVWFIRANSIHGSVLAAAGARNAVPEPVTGAPVMSLEHLLAVDPDRIVVLGGGAAGAENTVSELRRLDALRAVRHGRIGALPDPGLLIPGPRLLELVEVLARLIRDGEPER